SHLDTVIRIFQEGGYEVSVHRAKSPQDIEDVAARSDDVECIVVAGGDGSIHQAVNGLMKQELSQRPVLGILPVGTANDLAYALQLPKSIKEACEVIARGRIFKMDVGIVNNRYFVNVASAGLLSDVSPKVDVRVKNTLGQLAYYLKGLETLPTYRAFRIEFEQDGKNFCEDVLLVLAVNGLSVGGLRQLVPRASLTDGKLDILIVRQSGWPETMRLLFNLLGGGSVESDKIVQFQTDKVVIRTERPINSDLDGEWGPASPWDISVGPKISVLC
nr:YegS/Rv2252/BmrU family lipid kinase [Desulfitobacterium hafniense]